jgi:hypothetical protein
LAGFGAVLAGALLGTGVAKASPDVCANLAASPTVGTVEQLVFELIGEGFAPTDAGEVVAISVMSRCPAYKPVLERFIRAYLPDAGVSGGVGGRL